MNEGMRCDDESGPGMVILDEILDRSRIVFNKILREKVKCSLGKINIINEGKFQANYGHTSKKSL